MQALTAAASSGNMDLLDWMMSAFNVTLTGDNRVGVHVAYKVIHQCAAVYSVMCSHHSVESAVQPYIGHSSLDIYGTCMFYCLWNLWYMSVLYLEISLKGGNFDISRHQGQRLGNC